MPHAQAFYSGLVTADAYFKTGRFHKAVVVGAEVLSKIMDWNDRSTCVLFGDGAGAAVVTDEGDASRALYRVLTEKAVRRLTETIVP